jgi:hypothetical protein
MEQNVNVASGEDKFFMIIKATMGLPGVKIYREDFLRKELSKHFSKEVVELAIQENPASAGILASKIEPISKSCINYETNRVSAISAAAGIPGGLAMFGTVPADILQYYAHIIRVLQKLIYLYGWNDIYNVDGEFDDETTNIIVLFVGVMFGVNSANAAIAKLAQNAAVKVEKDLANKALTKGAIYPVVKKVSQILGVNMTKGVFAKNVAKIVPVIGGVTSGSITYVTFKPAAKKLKKHLEKLPTADVNFYEGNLYNPIDIDFIEEDNVEQE